MTDQEPVSLDVCAWCGDPLTAEEKKPPDDPRPGPEFGLLCGTCRTDTGGGGW